MRLNKSLIIIVFILLLANLVQFWPLYFKGLLPFPGDMLVGFHFPWSGGGFFGFNPWTTYKALNTVDTIKQFYPWKVLAIDLLRHGVWPLWNPYSFSGMPLMANLQSGIFFPLNLIYAFVPVLWGWVANVAGQLLLFGWFSYIFLRSQKLSRVAAVFGAVVAMNLSYISLWHWQLVITQSALFLSLILFLVNKYSQKPKTIYLLLIATFLSFGFFGGHAQTTVFVYLIFTLFAFYRRLPLKVIFLVLVLPAFLTAAQIFPSAQTYLSSAREGAATKDLFAPFVFHWKNIITVLAPDFFGHPSSRNYIGTDYRDMNAYFGLTAFIFSLISLGWLKQNKDVRFFLSVSIIGLLFATFPLVFIFDIFNIPILSSGVPARTIFIFQFGGGVLAAYGLERWLQSRSRHLPVIFFITTIFICLWILAIIDRETTGSVSRNNLILPTAVFIISSVLIIFNKYRQFLIIGIFFIVLFQYGFFFHKYNSFSPEVFVFPAHPVLTYLQKYAGINRFFGTEQAVLNQNFSVFYKIFDFKGYDSMYPKRIGQLVASVQTASIPQSFPRSDAFINHWSDRQSERLLDLLGVKYLLDKNDLLIGEWDEEPSKFNPERYKLLWQHRPWRIYQRKAVLPRVALFDKYQIQTDDPKIISQLYDLNFDFQKELILEEKPSISPAIATKKSTQVVSYQPNIIEIEEEADAPQLLWLSDNISPGWRATVDGQEVKILRANFSFRAISVPAGKHKIIFTYDPPAFKIGLAISLVSFTILGFFILKCAKKS